jgi:adenine-specific DNA-methyltransferase
MQELYEQGRIVQTKPGTVPRQKRYLDEMPGVPLQSIWLDIKPVQSQSIEKINYDTQKPNDLLERIIKLSSNEKNIDSIKLLLRLRHHSRCCRKTQSPLDRL